MYILAIIICVHEGAHTPEFKKLYLLLFNAITDALRLIEAGLTQEASELLIKAQQSSEELYINSR